MSADKPANSDVKASSAVPENPQPSMESSEDIPPISPEIIDGLAREGDFGFEMRIGRELRANPEARVRHGESYIDHRTDKEREFDYQYSLFNEHRRLQMAVECKNVFRDAPVVVCGQQRVRTESFHDVVWAGQGALRDPAPHVPLMTGAVSQVLNVVNSELYSTSDPKRSFVGKNIFRTKPPSKEKRLEAKRKNRPLSFEGYTIMGDDDGYSAWNQALGSAADMALQSLEFKRARPDHRGFAATVTLPVMVVPDETLWAVEFSADGEPLRSPEKTDHVAVFRDHRVRRVEKIGTSFYRVVRLPHIHFFTQTGLRNFLLIANNRHAMFWEYAFPEGAIEEIEQRFTPNA